MSEGDIIIDFFYEMWAYQAYKAAIAAFVFYLIYLLIRNPCLVDVGWSVVHLVIGASLYFTYCLGNYSKPIISIVLLFLWTLRLGGFLFTTRILTGHRDPRYEELSKNRNPYLYFLFQYEFQAFLVMFTVSPLYFVFRSPEIIIGTFYPGVALCLIGIVFEGVADQELHSYKKRKLQEKTRLQPDAEQREGENPGKKDFRICQEGLWKKSRHPNLFFEFLVWIGFALIGVNDWPSLLGFMGPIFLFLIVNFVTLPLSEEHMKKTRPLWNEYCQETNKYLPFIKL